MDVLRHGAIDVEVTFGAPVRLDATHDRKSVTRASEATVRRLCALALAGRPAEPAPHGGAPDMAALPMATSEIVAPGASRS